MTILMNEVMKRVRRIFLLRRLVAPSAFVLIAAAVVVSTVSISHVIANMPAFIDIPAVAGFLARAFAHTDVVVKSALVAGTLCLLLTLKGIIDSIKLSSVLQKA